MKSLVFICLFGVIAYVANAQKYDDKYDNIDIDEVMANTRLMEGYIQCIIDKGPCTAAGTQFKGNFKDGMQNLCAKCTEKQFDIAKRMGQHVYKKYPAYWKEIVALYDPESKYINEWMKKIGLP